jgi:RHS repeat-associated protein
MKKFSRKILALALSLSLLPYHITASSETTVQQMGSTEQVVFKMSQLYSVDIKELQDKIENGYSLVDLKNALVIKRNSKQSLETILANHHPEIVNHSQEANSEIKSELNGDYEFNVLGEESNPATEIDPSKLLTNITTREEAPYKISLDQESISTISGSLSYQQEDAFLPGRNGMSFSLVRSYNSQDAQFDEMKIGESYDHVYTVKWGAKIVEYQKTFIANTLMRAHEEIDYGCDGYVDYSGYTSSGYNVTSTEYSTSTGASNHRFTPVYGSWSECKSTGGGYYDPGDVPPPTPPEPEPEPEPSDPPPPPPPPPPGYCVGFCEYSVPSMDILATSERSRTAHYADYPSTITESTKQTATIYGDDYSETFTSYQDAQAKVAEINSKMNQVYSGTGWKEINGGIYQLVYYYHSAPEIISTVIDYDYYNTVSQSVNEKHFPIGKGWNWNIPFIETKAVNGMYKQFLYMDNGSVYEVDGNILKGYPWKDLTFELDNSINTPELKSKNVLKTMDGKNYYFNDQGYLIVISNSYGNKITFHYQNHSKYGTVLSSVKDEIGNSINISYSTDKVEIVNGDLTQKVTYQKTLSEGKELLTHVVGPTGLTTTYDYSIKQAQFNLFSSTPAATNPYALLTGVKHPTGAVTSYEYQDTPVTRYMGAYSVNQAYKIKKRSDYILLSNGVKEYYNVKEVTYEGDMGSSATSDLALKTTIDNKLTKTTYSIRKDYIDEANAPVFYTDEVNEKAANLSKNTKYKYNEIKRIPLPIEITTVNIKDPVDGVSNPTLSKIVTATKEYNDYGRVIAERDAFRNVSSLYVPQEITLTAGIFTGAKFKLLVPTQTTETIYKNENGLDQSLLTNYVYTKYPNGNIQKQLTSITSNNTLLSKNEAIYNEQGNLGEFIEYNKNQDGTIVPKRKQRLTYHPSYNYAYIQSISEEVSDANAVKSIITKQFDFQKTTGLPTEFTDGNGNKTKYVYDLLKRIKKVTFVDPNRTPESYPVMSFVYNDVKNEIETTNEVGMVYKQVWNPLGWKTEEQVFEDSVFKTKKRLSYDSVGRIVNETDARGNITTHQYDGWNRPTGTYGADYQKDPVSQKETGSKTTFVYDDILYKVSSTDLNQNTLEETYDEFGRLLTKTKKWVYNGTAKTNVIEQYTYTGNDYAIKNSKGYLVQYTQDAFDRLTAVTYPKGQVLDHAETTSYKYDMVGNLVQITHPDNNTVQKEYDELGRLIKQIDPSGSIEINSYDGNNNLVKHIDKKGNRVTYSYTARNLPKLKQAFEGTVLADQVEMEYNDAGTITKMITGIGTDTKTTTYEYYQANDLEPAKYVGALKNLTLPDGSSYKYFYNPSGDRTKLDVKIGTSAPWSINYTHDSLNRIKSVSESSEAILETYTYQNNGLLNKVEKANYSQSTLTYDGLLLDQQTEKKLSDLSSMGSYSLDYDGSENITSVVNNGKNSTYGYDDLDRITTSSIQNEAYWYDLRGNRETLLSDQPLNTSTVEYKYDVLDRLSKVVTENGNIVEYKYNGDGLMYERSESGLTTRYYYDGQDIIAEGTVKPDQTVELKARYIRGANGLIARISEDATEKANYGGVAYYHQNQHGDITSLRDRNGNVLKSYEYDIWGNILTSSSTQSFENPFTYSGEYWDKFTSLQYLRARWYDPSMGRFISEDTYEGDIKNPLSLNLYTYVENNPLKYKDPSGNVPVIEMGAIEGRVTKKEKNAIAEWSDQAAYAASLLIYGSLYTPPGSQTFEAAMDATSGNGGGMYFGGKAGTLKYLGNKKWESNAGIIYGLGSAEGNRVRHVLVHSMDSGVEGKSLFNVGKTKVLALIDESWSKKDTATTYVNRGNDVYEISMGRVVGTRGERKIRIVMKAGTSEIISAYPIR